jgi:methylmalonyl-CoA epimerase
MKFTNMPKLEHVAIAITDPGLADVFEGLLGQPVYKIEDVPSEHVTTYFIKAGSSKLELVSPTSGASPVQRFLDKRGPGLHHIAFEIRDIDQAFQRALHRGLRLASNAVVEGADGKRVFFVHPAAAGGVLIEFCEASRPVGTAARMPIGGTDYPVRTSGRKGADPLLILATTRDLAFAESLLAHFEPTHHVTMVIEDGAANPGETGSLPASFDDLAAAGFSADAVISFGSLGATLFEADSPNFLPRRSALFAPPADLLRSETLPPGLLLIVKEPVDGMSAAAFRNALILPQNEATSHANVVDLVFPLLARHIRDAGERGVLRDDY